MLQGFFFSSLWQRDRWCNHRILNTQPTCAPTWSIWCSVVRLSAGHKPAAAGGHQTGSNVPKQAVNATGITRRRQKVHSRGEKVSFHFKFPCSDCLCYSASVLRSQINPSKQKYRRDVADNGAACCLRSCLSGLFTTERSSLLLLPSLSKQIEEVQLTSGVTFQTKNPRGHVFIEPNEKSISCCVCSC